MFRQLLNAAQDFVETIEAAGGVCRNPNGYTAPVGDPTWTDLGDSYLRMCRALGRTPAYAESDPYAAIAARMELAHAEPDDE